MCDFEPGEKVQCVDATPHSHPLHRLLYGNLRLNAIYIVHDVYYCSECNDAHVIVKEIPGGPWNAARFRRLKPNEGELLIRLKKYVKSPNPDGRPDPVKVPDKELEPTE